MDEPAELAAEEARDGGLRLRGEGGLLVELTRHLMQAAVEAGTDLYLVEEAGRTGGRGSRSGGNARNGYRNWKVMTEVGSVTVQVPRDRLGTFASGLLPKYARRTSGLEEMVLSLTAKGLTSGEIVAHLAETYGMEISKETVSTITDKALDAIADWRTRPLDPVCPVLFVDCVTVKSRDGEVANRPEDGGKGAKYWQNVLAELQNRGVRDMLIPRLCRGPASASHPITPAHALLTDALKIQRSECPILGLDARVTGKTPYGTPPAVGLAGRFHSLDLKPPKGADDLS